MEMQSPPNMYGVDDKMAPIPQERSISDMDLNNQVTPIPLEEVKPQYENDSSWTQPMKLEEESPEFGRTSEEDRRVIEEEGGIFLSKADFHLTLETPLGAYDQYGNFHHTAIPGGATLTSMELNLN